MNFSHPTMGGLFMALETRITSLQHRHTEIDEEILSLQTRPSPDDARIQQLKREKLMLKDELARLEAEREERAA
jgi:hypothetical protein